MRNARIWRFPANPSSENVYKKYSSGQAKNKNIRFLNFFVFFENRKNHLMKTLIIGGQYFMKLVLAETHESDDFHQIRARKKV